MCKRYTLNANEQATPLIVALKPGLFPNNSNWGVLEKTGGIIPGKKFEVTDAHL
jgi:hypothetical protein